MKKKIIFSIILAIVLISLAIFVNLKSKNDIYNKNTLSLEPVKENSSSTIDVLNAKDWEAVLSGISSSTVGTTPSQTKTGNSLSPLSGTWTGQLSKDFLSQYLQLQGGNAINQATEQDLAQSLADAYQQDMRVTYYYSTDLKTFPSSNLTKTQSYGNNFISTENVIAKEYSTKYGPTPSAYVTAEMFKKISLELAKIEVPEDLGTVHLQIINNDYNMYLALKNIADLEQSKQRDAIKELSWYKLYNDITTSQPKLYTEISKYFNKNGIIFSNTEAGYAWSKF